MKKGYFWLGVVGVLLLVAVLAGRPTGSTEPYDPDSTEPLGTKALVLLLEEYGASVDVGGSLSEGTDVVFVIVDDLTEEQRDEVRQFVRGGGRLVIADPYSQLTPFAQEDFGSTFLDPEDIREQGDCTVPQLRGARAIQPGYSLDFEVPSGARSCFGDGRNALLVVEESGDGFQVSIGGADLFTNEALGDVDNAVLAVDLLAPTPGTQVAWLERDAGAVAESGSMWSLVSTPVRAALLQLGVAALLYLAYRARRLGRPIREPQPVQLAGSELVGAVGNLLQQTHDPNRAARLLRHDLRRSLADRLGLPADAPPELVADVVADRFGLDGARAHRAIVDLPVANDDEVVLLAREIEAIRQEVLHGHALVP